MLYANKYTQLQHHLGFFSFFVFANEKAEKVMCDCDVASISAPVISDFNQTLLVTAKPCFGCVLEEGSHRMGAA